MESEILFSVSDGVATISLNRPEKRNSLNRPLLEKFMQALEEVEKNPAVKMMLLTSSAPAPGAFCSGADLSGANSGQVGFERKIFSDILKKMRTLNKPSMAKISGLCMGGGLGLALSCDMVFATDSSFFCTPEVLVGLYPLMISPLIYENCKSKKCADAFILTGKKVSAPEAFEMGMVTEYGTEEEMDHKIQAVTAQLKRIDGDVVAFGKRSVQAASAMTFDASMDHLGTALDELFSRPETQAKIQTFLRKDRG